MIRQCAWCQVLMGQVEPKEDPRVTHAICESCKKKMQKELDEMRQA